MSVQYTIRFGHHAHRLVPLLFLFVLFVAALSHGSPIGNRKSGRSSVFSLFNLKEKSKFWSEAVIRSDFDDLKSSIPSRARAGNYTKAGNIANYLQLLEVESMYLPVPVNFIFIGFEGKGNQEFKLNAEELERWFTKIDHIFEHTRVPQIGEALTQFYKISIDKEQRHHLPIISHINYNFSVHAIQMGEKVTSAFQHAIDVLARKDDVSDTRDDKAGLWQVDVGMMDVIITSLVEYLQLENAYNIFILNPKRNMKMEKYGYRRGLSETEINFLKENKDLQARILQSGSVAESVLVALDSIKRPLYEKHPMEKFALTLTEDTDTVGGLFEWVELRGGVGAFIHSCAEGLRIKRHGLVFQPLYGMEDSLSGHDAVLWESDRDSILIVDTLVCFSPCFGGHLLSHFGDDNPLIEWYNICQDALNNVERLYQGKDTADIVQSKVLQLLNGKNKDLKLLMEKVLKSGDFSGLHAECLTDTWIGKDRWAFIDLSAGPFSWGPAVGGEGVRTELSLPNVGKTIGAAAEISEDEAEDRLQEAIQEKFAVFGDKDHQAIDILLAEIDIYELFSFKHCKGRKVKLALCEELDERMEDLKKELQSFEGEESDESHKKKALDALKRMENWNLFSDTHEEFQTYTVARDSFLAHLGATLWGSMRHIIAPSLADGAFHYYEKISFQLFFITQEKVTSMKQLPVDVKDLNEGLSSLLLPSQKVMFSPHMLALSEDPALAMAFSVSRRAAAVPVLLVNGTYRKTVRSYLDSSILQHQLQRLNEHGSLKASSVRFLKYWIAADEKMPGTHAHSRLTLEVPLFWFIHNDSLFVDKHYQAKALSDMVIVVQSEPSAWESHLQCNGRSLLWNLRRPIKPALAAVAEHLAGLVPLHLAYSHAHETAIEDWIWSVGCNPLSVTSQGWHISQFQSDTIARSYILTALEESILLMNSAIHLLVMEHTCILSLWYAAS
ncbi:hypothetical protein RHGRI_000854 [Rhododendron griersonianum]|uniref:DUF7906 domain-containing protein n=1 Tax=Rhododendron griersonianum TaxID=479676 RepID=A0AAV6LJ95_9ERIC|nr:hypothetical protein RHGRI_000854 [Rhododendron griersonianum]